MPDGLKIRYEIDRIAAKLLRRNFSVNIETSKVTDSLSHPPILSLSLLRRWGRSVQQLKLLAPTTRNLKIDPIVVLEPKSIRRPLRRAVLEIRKRPNWYGHAEPMHSRGIFEADNHGIGIYAAARLA
jgi:hypothetical protein